MFLFVSDFAEGHRSPGRSNAKRTPRARRQAGRRQRSAGRRLSRAPRAFVGIRTGPTGGISPTACRSYAHMRASLFDGNGDVRARDARGRSVTRSRCRISDRVDRMGRPRRPLHRWGARGPDPRGPGLSFAKSIRSGSSLTAIEAFSTRFHAPRSISTFPSSRKVLLLQGHASLPGRSWPISTT